MISYENSLTHIVQEDLLSIQSKLIEMDSSLIMDADSDIYQFLRDKKAISSFDFQLRRYIQNMYPELMEGFVKDRDYPNLNEDGNVSWPDYVNKSIAQKLAQKWGTSNGALGKWDSWYKYLTGRTIPMDRESLYRITLFLKMNLESTIRMFLSVGTMDTYCMRNPQDFIFYFCTARSESLNFNEDSYDWESANQLWLRYVTARENHEIGISSAQQAAGTQMLSNQLNDLIHSSDLPHVIENNLINYMLECDEEFVSIEKKVRGKRCTYVPLDPYSKTNYDNFLQFTKYLSKLYPSIICTEIENLKNSHYVTDHETPIQFDENGFPLLADLSDAMLSDIFDQVNVKNAQSEEMKEIVNLINGFKMEIAKVQVNHTVSRNTILLMSFFFLLKFNDFETKYETQEEIENLYANNTMPMDNCIAEIVHDTEKRDDYDDVNEATYLSYIVEDMNHILKVFRFPEIYLPNVLDRYILAALMPIYTNEGYDVLADTKEIIQALMDYSAYEEDPFEEE